MARHDEDGSYDQARRLRRGWQLWTGDGWDEVRSVTIRGDKVLITVTDGRVFRTGYLDAVLCRKTPPAPLAAACSCDPRPGARHARTSIAVGRSRHTQDGRERVTMTNREDITCADAPAGGAGPGHAGEGIEYRRRSEVTPASATPRRPVPSSASPGGLAAR
jgi:hypothetical protein